MRSETTQHAKLFLWQRIIFTQVTLLDSCVPVHFYMKRESSREYILHWYRCPFLFQMVILYLCVYLFDRYERWPWITFIYMKYTRFDSVKGYIDIERTIFIDTWTSCFIWKRWNYTSMQVEVMSIDWIKCQRSECEWSQWNLVNLVCRENEEEEEKK